MKISILSHDLSENGMYRVYTLAEVLKRQYEVEIIGPIFGKEIYKPCNTDQFKFKSVKGCVFPYFLFSIREILKYITGDVVYAYKPLLTSYGIGLLKKLASKCPVVIDIDDWPVGHWLQEYDFSLRRVLSRSKNLLIFSRPKAPLYSIITSEFFIRFADNITVTSDFLKQKFGGIKVPHAQNTKLFDPCRFNRNELRQKWGLNNIKVIMFLGSLNPYKGIENILKALDKLNTNKEVKLMMIVDKGRRSSYIKQLLNAGKAKIIPVEGLQHVQKIPEFLSMADLVVIPQRATPITNAQVPAKLIDAMSMANPIIATNISDIPQILKGCGLIVEPNDIDDLADKITYLVENENIARELGKKAREKCKREFSWDAIEPILTGVFDKYD